MPQPKPRRCPQSIVQWSAPAKKRRSELETDFKEDLKVVAERLAHHDKSTQVAPHHVDKAFEILVRIGLARKAWYDKPGFLIGFGGFMCGLAPSMPDIASAFGKVAPGISAGGLVACFTVGSICLLFGYLHSQLPLPPAKEWNLKGVAKAGVLLVVGLVAIALGAMAVKATINQLFPDSPITSPTSNDPF